MWHLVAQHLALAPSRVNRAIAWDTVTFRGTAGSSNTQFGFLKLANDPGNINRWPASCRPSNMSLCGKDILAI
jgi:hypothetical protein